MPLRPASPFLAAALFVAAGPAAAQSTSSPPTATTPPAAPAKTVLLPGTAPYLNFLKAWFEAADLDHDGYLDKAELAKAFRGPKAVPPADPAPATPVTSASKSGDEPADAAKTPATTPATAPARTGKRKTPTRDVQFLAILDTDQDSRVSRAEYDEWAPGYANYGKQVNDLQVQIAKQIAAQNLAIARQQQAQLNQMLANQRYAAMHAHHNHR